MNMVWWDWKNRQKRKDRVERDNRDCQKDIALDRGMVTVSAVIEENTSLKTRLAAIYALCGAGETPENRISDATNYEFGLRIMKKQLEDQLIYAGDGDKSTVSTVCFDSVESLSQYLLCMITLLLHENERMRDEDYTKNESNK